MTFPELFKPEVVSKYEFDFRNMLKLKFFWIFRNIKFQGSKSLNRLKKKYPQKETFFRHLYEGSKLCSLGKESTSTAANINTD